MTREELAEALLLDVQGLDTNTNQARDTNTMGNGYGYDSDVSDDEIFGADDPVKAVGLSTLPIQLQVANAASLNVDLFKTSDLAAAALPTGILSPAIASYRDIIAYVLANPSLLQSITITTNESSTGGAPVLSSLRISPKRVTPFGANTSNEIRVQSYQTTQDFQSNRTSIPLKVALDSFTYLNFTSDVNGSGAAVTFNVTFFIGRRVQNRKQLSGGAPMRQLPGGRGPVPVKR